jgi:FAD/FMN-containing dehydrogenase
MAPERACLWILLAILFPVGGRSSPAVVNDVTQLNPIVVSDIATPTTLEELVNLVAHRDGPISIGGGRFSMGGQTATENAVQIDMRQFDRVLAFSAPNKEITVQAGITWRKIQEYIDPYNLSLQVMQTYANFTVGGALSVNAHGRYIGLGPLVLSVKSIRVVLADGTVVLATPTENRDLFYGAIGGYGSLGVIAEATLALTDNVRVERRSEVMPLSRYWSFFNANIHQNPDVIFHNADIYPNAYDTVRVTSYVRTEKPVTVADRLWPKDRSYRLDRFIYWVISEWPGGKWIRQHIVDPIYFMGHRVEWRNYEASYDVKELEPSSRRTSTYVLQEYFVPVEHLNEFVPRMAGILNRHHVNVINISIRHAKQDPGTVMAWARGEVFAYVLYYKQGTGSTDRQAVAVWTRELIDAAVTYGGAYYLPYQILATPEQFHAAYPNADRLFELKRKLDPTYKFRNKLWDAYYHPDPATVAASPAQPSLSLDTLATLRGYKRDEAQTYLTLPEWILVYSPGEYAAYLKDHVPSGYPYFGSIAQFWGYYRDIWKITRSKYSFNLGYHVMVIVIGSSFSVEYGIKGLYENTVGRVSEWFAGGALTPEDHIAANVAQSYDDFIRVRPWYEYSFMTQLKMLWRVPPMWGPHMVRKWERRLILSLEYLVKAQYATVITVATKAAYGDADSEILIVADHIAPAAVGEDAKIRLAGTLPDGSLLLGLPRYEEFRDAIVRLARAGVQFRQFAGNTDILLTCIVPASWNYDLPDGRVVLSRPILTNPSSQRIGVIVPAGSLHRVILGLDQKGIQLEHLYDY